MVKRGGAMHVVTTRRHYKDKTYEAHLLRRSYRQGGRVKNETVANLSSLPVETIELIRRSLRGESFVAAHDAFTIDRSRPHGHVAAVAAMARQLGFPGLLGPACAERDLVFALLVARACRPGSKLATVRWWADTTLAPDLGVEAADTDDVYAAMDWLLSRQDHLERQLAHRHLTPGGLVLYDLSGSWVEGRMCPLAAHGYSRDGKRGKRQITYGLVTDPDGRPVAVEVFAGNTGDPTAFTAAVDTVRERFKVARVIMVGARGMITQSRIEDLKTLDGVGWLTALRAPAIQKLAGQGAVQLSLFDQSNLAEIAHPDYPGERLVACRNPALATERARKRTELLAATDAELDKIVAAVDAGRIKNAAAIGVRVGRNINKFKMAKHYDLTIAEGRFSWRRTQDSIDAEAALDGIYVLRTSVTADTLDTAGVVEAYKRLTHVERDFRSLKTVDVQIRPIHHRLEDRVRAHVLLCMVASYLIWHLRRAWAPLCFTDQQPPHRIDPVAKAERSAHAKNKASRRTLGDGQPVHSFATLIDHLATLSRDDITFPGNKNISMNKLAEPTPTQRRAFELLNAPIPLRLA